MNNPSLKAAYYRWQESVYRYQASGYLPDPALSYRAFLQAVETRVGPQRAGVAIQQGVPWPAKLFLERSMAGEASQRRQQDFFERRNLLFFQVQSVYLEYHYVKMAIAITKANRELLEHLRRVVQVRQKVGGKLPDTVKIQIEWIVVDDQLQELIDRLPSVKADLNALLNRPIGTDLPLVPLLKPEVLSDDEAALRQQLSSRNPQLMALKFQVAEESQSVRLAKTYQLPDFVLGFDYIDTGPSRTPNTPGSGKDSVQAWIGVTLPIWRGKYRAQISEAKQRVRDVCNEKYDLENGLMARLETALYQLKDSRRRIELYEKTLLPELELLLNSMQRAYEVGTEDVLSLVDVERQLLDIELSLIKAVTDQGKATAQIDWLIGTDCCDLLRSSTDLSTQGTR